MNQGGKKKWLLIAVCCGVIFTVLYFIVNFPIISDFISGILDVVAPILIGIVIAYILNPVMKLFEYKIFKRMKHNNAKRILSIFMSYICLVVAFLLFLGLIIPQLISSASELVAKYEGYMASITDIINSFINGLTNDPNLPEYINEEMIIDFVKNLFTASNDMVQTVVQFVTTFGMELFVGIKNIFLGLFISIYILAAKERLHAQVIRLTAAIFSEKSRNYVLRYARIANRTFGNFFLGTILESMILAIITLIVLLIFDIPYALLVSFLVGITNVIPFFGPFIGAIPSAFIIFVAAPEKCILFIVIIFILQQIEGNIIAPKVLGSSTGISSLGVLVAIIIMGAYFGIIGMVVGVPIFAMIVTVCNEILESNLRKKGLPTETEDYYPSYSLVDPHDHHEKLFNRILSSIGAFFKKLFSVFKKKDKKQSGDSQDGKKS